MHVYVYACTCVCVYSLVKARTDSRIIILSSLNLVVTQHAEINLFFIKNNTL